MFLSTDNLPIPPRRRCANVGLCSAAAPARFDNAKRPQYNPLCKKCARSGASA